MNLNKTVFILGMSLLAIGSVKAEGVGSSGGGSGIILTDGSVHLVDMTKGSIDPAQVADQEEITQMFFEKNRYVKTIAEKNEKFFACAIEMISKTNLVFKEQWIKSLGSVRVLNVEFPLIPKASKEILDAQPLPIFADSSENVGSVNQVALASYSKGDLWVQRRFYGALPENDQCGLGVHEAIRHLNYTVLALKPLTTSEIEDTTRALMSGENSTAEQELNKNYLPPKSLSPVLNLVHRTQDWAIDSLANPALSKTQVHELQDISSKMRDIERASVRAMMESQDLNSLANLLLDAAKTINDYRFKYWDVQSTIERERLKSFSNEALDSGDDLLTSSSIGIVTELGTSIPDNYFNRFLVNAAITEKLDGFKKFDVKKIKIVNRVF